MPAMPSGVGPATAADAAAAGSDWQGSAWPTFYAEGDSGTDTDTSDDDGTEVMQDDDLRGLDPARLLEQAFWAYRATKRRWRRLTGKPVRRARRFAKRRGKGKGSGRAFFEKGKGSGKGFGRRRNPRGRDGQIMRCSICGSEEHLRRVCPQASQRVHSGSKISGLGSPWGMFPWSFLRFQMHY